jgi:hypothetical protein
MRYLLLGLLLILLQGCAIDIVGGGPGKDPLRPWQYAPCCPLPQDDQNCEWCPGTNPWPTGIQP